MANKPLDLDKFYASRTELMSKNKSRAGQVEMANIKRKINSMRAEEAQTVVAETPVVKAAPKKNTKGE